jgi:hypothetical protein
MFWQKGNPADIHVAVLDPKTAIYSNDVAVTFAANVTTDVTWISPHLVIKAKTGLYVMFYTAQLSGKRAIRAATSASLTGTYTMVTGFQIDPALAWEHGAGGCAEIDCGIRVIGEDTTHLNLYILYTCQEGTSSNSQGWARVQIDKNTPTVTFVEKYAGNPLEKLKPAGDTQYRDGGSLPYTIGGYYMIWACARDHNVLMLRMSTDPMFNTVDSEFILSTGGLPSAAGAIEKTYFFPLPNTNNELWALYFQCDNQTAGKGWYASAKFFRAYMI